MNRVPKATAGVRRARRVSPKSGLVLLGIGAGGCNLGPFPNLLERLDPLTPVEGQVEGWISAEDDRTQVLVLSKKGHFLHAAVERNAAVEVEVGSYEVEGSSLTMRGDYRFIFPKESGPVKNRTGARLEDIDTEETHTASLDERGLSISDFGSFIKTADFVRELDLTTKEGRGCLLRFAQVSVRTAQARIRNLGGGGTVIYHKNKSTFEGFLGGEMSIVLDSLLSPHTTIDYDGFQDFPEVRFDGAFVTQVNTAGDGTLDDSITVTVLETTDAETGLAMGGSAGASGQEEDQILAQGRIIYGPEDPIRLEQGDVVGGSYDWELVRPVETQDNFSYEFLQDLDLRACHPAFKGR